MKLLDAPPCPTSFVKTYPRGLGDAVLQAKAFVGNEPFVDDAGDDLMDITDDTGISSPSN